MVGTSGNALERSLPVVATACNLPALIKVALEVPENMATVSPPMVAVVAGVPPL